MNYIFQPCAGKIEYVFIKTVLALEMSKAKPCKTVKSVPPKV